MLRARPSALLAAIDARCPLLTVSASSNGGQVPGNPRGPTPNTSALPIAQIARDAEEPCQQLLLRADAVVEASLDWGQPRRDLAFA